MVAKANKCITRGCGKKVRCRGVCESCYFALRKAVKLGKVSGWRELERMGLALPPQKSPVLKAIDRAKRALKRRRNKVAG